MTSALDRLKKAANLVPIRKAVMLSDGTEFEFWHTNLTLAERERASKAAKGNNENMGVQLLVAKATDESGVRMFVPGQIAELKNEVRSSDLEQIILALIQDDIVEVPEGK
jgi:hypothetical protein